MSKIIDFQMPMLGEVMEQGTIGEWMVEAGDEIEMGDVLLTVENDKALLDVESPVDGVIKEVLCADGETVAVGAVIARIEVE